MWIVRYISMELNFSFQMFLKLKEGVCKRNWSWRACAVTVERIPWPKRWRREAADKEPWKVQRASTLWAHEPEYSKNTRSCTACNKCGNGRPPEKTRPYDTVPARTKGTRLVGRKGVHQRGYLLEFDNIFPIFRLEYSWGMRGKGKVVIFKNHVPLLVDFFRNSKLDS